VTYRTSLLKILTTLQHEVQDLHNLTLLPISPAQLIN